MRGSTQNVSIYIDFDEMIDEIIAYCRQSKRPEEIYEAGELESWAEENGYTKPKEEDDS